MKNATIHVIDKFKSSGDKREEAMKACVVKLLIKSLKEKNL